MHIFSTPMMRQYQAIKDKYPGCLLFYRMGDFYELFLEDAHIGARVLNITLTGKAGGKDGRIPMAGIPYHAVDSYLAKLIKAGYKVAICEQLSPPGKKGLVERDVIRIVTPGTLLDEKSLEKKDNNYLVSISLTDDHVAIASADLSTGYFAVAQKEGNYKEWLLDELSRLSPSECIIPDHLYNDATVLKLLKNQQGMNIYSLKEWPIYAKHAEKRLQEHFEVTTLAAFGIEGHTALLQTAAALLGYLQETQQSTVKHIKKITVYETDAGMVLDKSTMLNLEIFSTIREHDTHGSLLSVLDQTVTAMGGRLLKLWLKKPLLDKKDITARHAGVALFLKDHKKRTLLRSILEEISDIERIISRLSVNIGNARDLLSIRSSLIKILEVKMHLEGNEYRHTALCRDIVDALSPTIQTIIDVIDHTIAPEPPIDIRSGGLIKRGKNTELDGLRDVIKNNKQWMADLEATERKSTGIATLKIRYNQVFGFYIEISKSHLHMVPDTYTRKQTLVNGERFVTDDLKKHEELILTAEERANELEYELFMGILRDVLSYVDVMQQASEAMAILDCILTFALISQTYGYTQPTIIESGELRITQGRHAVVERLLEHDKHFVPNDLCLDETSRSLLLITGPNMAGKSVFIRQVALIVLLNQIGCFVPAEKADLSLVDRIFVRSGASDVITSGLSTFMVEMVETAHILHNATSHSLIVMDEIGRGTSTYDGISIAWAVAQYLVTHFSPPPKTLFATHYHELQQLEKEYPTAINNFHMAVAEENGSPIFLHTLLPGGASHSFGVAVAKLAGVPQAVITDATELLKNLERRDNETDMHHHGVHDDAIPQVPGSTEHSYTEWEKKLLAIDISHITPIDAMNQLVEIQESLKRPGKTSSINKKTRRI
jgi:DNA mismatch repair protein MutS